MFKLESRPIVSRVATTALGMVLLTSATQPVEGSFAVQCTGTARFSDTVTGELVTRNYELPRQVYVFDEATERVQRAMEPRQEFEDVCPRDGYLARIDFAPGLIQVRSEGEGVLCDFKVSRVTGEAEFSTRQDLPGGRYNEFQWRMTCSRTEIPVFDRSRNPF